jgi:hypothetical protein
MPSPLLSPVSGDSHPKTRRKRNRARHAIGIGSVINFTNFIEPGTIFVKLVTVGRDNHSHANDVKEPTSVITYGSGCRTGISNRGKLVESGH